MPLIPLLHRFRSYWVPAPETGAGPYHARAGLRPAGGPRAAHVLARALCRYRCVDLPAGLGRGEALAFLGLQLQTWQPFEHSDAVVWLRGGRAMVWAWDQAALKARCQSRQLPAPAGLVFPETLLREVPPDGLYLHHCHDDGVEGECWRDGVLRASRWWPVPPAEEEWRNFCRSAGPALGGLPDGSRPAPRTPAPARDDVRRRGLLRLSRGALPLAAMARLALAAVLLLLTGLSVVLLRDSWRLQRDVARLEAGLAPQRAAVDTITQARQRTLDLMPSLVALDAATRQPSTLALLRHLTEQLPGSGSRLEELQLQGRELRLKLRIPAGSARLSFVGALEAGGWLSQVRELAEAGDPDVLVLAARLERVAPSASAAPAPQPGSPPAAVPADAPGDPPAPVPDLPPGMEIEELIPLEPVNG